MTGFDSKLVSNPFRAGATGPVTPAAQNQPQTVAAPAQTPAPPSKDAFDGGGFNQHTSSQVALSFPDKALTTAAPTPASGEITPASVDGQITGTANLIADFKNARTEMESITTELSRSQAELKTAQQDVASLTTEQGQVTAELTDEEESLALVEEVAANQPAGATEVEVPPGRQGAWARLLAKADIQVSNEGGRTVYRHDGQAFDTPDTMMGFMRQRFRSRISKLRERLGNLNERLSQARDRLSAAMDKVKGLMDQLAKQRAKVQTLKAQAGQAVAGLKGLRDNPALWGGIPADLRSQFAARISGLEEDYNSEVAASGNADQRAAEAIERAQQNIAAAAKALDQANHQLQQGKELQKKPAAAQSQAAKADDKDLAQAAALEELKSILAAQPKDGLDADRQARLNPFEKFISGLSREIKDVQNRQGQAHKLDQGFMAELGQRLRSELSHHQALLESFDTHRREQIQALLAQAIGSN